MHEGDSQSIDIQGLSHQTSMFLMAPTAKLKKKKNKMEVPGLEYET
jgi:hypothetical protein